MTKFNGIVTLHKERIKKELFKLNNIATNEKAVYPN